MKKTLLFILILLSYFHTKAQCWKTMAAGYSHTAAVRTDGTLWTWGSNDQGQLGNSSPTSKNAPAKMGTDNDWETVAAGWGHTVALKTDGSLWAWGYGGLGQIGNGSFTTNFNAPQQIGIAKNWQTIVTGHGHTAALKTDGSLWAWGNNFSGQLGIGNSLDRNTPTRVGTANDWQLVAAGKLHTVALKKDGTLWTWGNNTYGTLGDGTTTKKTSPVQIGTENNWKTISAGSDHTIAIKKDGTLWAWGDNTYGALGDGTTTNKLVPTQIGSSADWKTIDGGVNYTIAVKTDGTLWAWGFNSDGELGNGTKINSLVPLQIGTENNWQMIDGGSVHTVAIKTDESLWTWGSNSLGQLGDETSIDKNVPTVLNCIGSLIVTTKQINISCINYDGGSAYIASISGGTAPYSYLWSNGDTTASITGLKAGDYSCTITDANMLSITKSFVIIEPSPLFATTTSTNTDCNGNNNGIITIIANGGTAPYQYGISNMVFQPSNVFTNLSPGTYELYVKDFNGCTVSNTIIITVNYTPPPTAAAQTFNTGATVTNLQAVGANIQWYNDITDGTALDLSAALKTGKYYVSQTINGCESSRTAVDVIITTVSANEPIPTNGLLAYYPFTGNANDTSGKGNNGIATDVTLTEDRFGKSNSAYFFNGTSSNIESDIANYPLKGGSRTITGWFKMADPINSAESDFCLLNYGNINDPNYWFKISFYRKGYLDMQFDSKTFSSQENYFNDEWTFFAMTFDETNNNYSLYINGVYKMGGTASLYTNGFNTFFRIGRNKLDNYFEGAIDDIGIWNRVLTQEEITGLYTPAPVNNDLFTLIPDSNFEQKLIDLEIDSGSTDGKVLTSKISTLTHLNVSNSSISDLTGIQDFAQLTDLYCNQNQLTALNVSKNTFLKTLDCNNNKIETLDVSKNIALDTLSSYSNRLTALDVKINKALKKLDCGSNQISTLDVSANTDLIFLGCNTSLLTTLDVSKNTALKLLDCRENKLTNLDVSTIGTLTELYCQSNQLTNLDISKNKALEFLNCSKNLLTTLNVSVNTALVGLYSNSNQLTNLNLKNGNNTNLAYLNFKINPNLSCIQVDDINYSNENWSTKKDATANFNTDCQNSNQFTYIPDSNFEQKLIDLGIDTDGLNGKITIADISAVTTLDLSNSNIKDLTGIESFTALNILDCSNNQLVILDLSKNTKLQILYVTGNPLVYINLQNGNNHNFIVKSITDKKLSSTGGTTFLGITTLGCIKVDNADYSNANWSKIKETTTMYSETCTLGLEDSQFSKAAVYPNPTKGEVNILNIAVEKATVYNVSGQLVKTFTLDSANTNNTINLSGLPKGVYFVYLINQDVASVKKVIVE
ncbi:RCC1 domain-containing protein [Flavobacterium aquicola]|uniref:Putative secreted protein (Por secretion system target) n=1 Tax=Flavobacterium aquicola TaxID=1682742 RepID=A0A3E0ELI6_9FLAO|nr:LamG-like jellyroll fold domain-containing protein [Flavobacterium aquicola]REG98995.1 putative secreted protein (Por secretion system target) [Flavobacterium aquicola]